MKKLLIYIFVSVFTINSYSQINLQIFTSEQNIIYEATDSILFIVRQDYVLKDTTTGMEYGRGGKEYFGRTYGLGVLSDNKLWCENKVKMPWLTDNNYAQYRSIDSIQPVLSKTAIRRVTEKQFTETELQQFSPITYDSLLNKLSIANLPLKNPLPNITKQTETQDNTGWIVIIYTKEDISTNESCDLHYLIYRPAPQFKPNVLESTIKQPSITTNLLGGIYFTTDFSIGKVELSFAGVLNKRPMNWYISAIPKQKPVSQGNTGLTQITGEESFIKVKFIHKDGFVLKNLCNIKLENSDETFCTDKNGVVKIPVSGNDKVFILLNGVKAACGKKGETLQVICKFSNGKFVPKKPIKKCE